MTKKSPIDDPPKTAYNSLVICREEGLEAVLAANNSAYPTYVSPTET